MKTHNIQLLDCTVRDGGYINDWEFGQNRLLSIFERLVDSGVDIIEIGFLDDRRPFDLNRSIGPDTESLKKIWRCIVKRPQMVVGMIDYGTCDINNIEPFEGSFLDGIRVIFKKQKMQEALDFCRQLNGLGYKVFAQLVSITSYEYEDLQELIKLANDVKPYAVSMVDTYGLLLPEKLLFYSNALDENLDPDIRLGFHAHNNLQMGFANALTFLNRKTNRDVLVDATLYGMGKSAGNAPIELLAKLLNDRFGKKYSIRPMIEAIEESILPIFNRNRWGYQKNFYMVAKEECHPNYLSWFNKQGNLSQSDLDELLSRIEPEEKKLLYDEEVAKIIYEEYIREKYDDESAYKSISNDFGGKELLLIGPGKNVDLQRHLVTDYIIEYHPIVIAVNHIPKGIKVDYVFITKSSRYEDMTISLYDNSGIRVIATSNITFKNEPFDYVVTRKPLLESNEMVEDNSFLMFLRVLKNANIRRVACAGFDGYSNREENYVDPSMEYEFIKSAALYLNNHVRVALVNEFSDLDIDFVTYSHYNEVIDMDNAAY